MAISNTLHAWYRQHRRDLPWRETKDAYKIWVSEVILQQTRVTQGLPYYQRFIESFPDVKSLALADESQVLYVWQGLGYYSRARNMHAAARQVLSEYNGSFPTGYATLRSLPGVGPYTAAAVASIAGRQKVAVVDGNVIRLISRLFGIDSDPNLTHTKSVIRKLSESLLADHDPGEMNQAIMEFGALQCTPGLPDCKSCPLHQTCFAYQNGQVASIPVKTRKPPPSPRFLHALVIRVGGKNISTFLAIREGKDIWKGLYTFPFIESSIPLDLAALLGHPDYRQLFENKVRVDVQQGPEMTHMLTHQKLHVRFFLITMGSAFSDMPFPSYWQQVTAENLHDFPMPRLMHRFLEQYPELREPK